MKPLKFKYNTAEDLHNTSYITLCNNVYYEIRKHRINYVTEDKVDKYTYDVLEFINVFVNHLKDHSFTLILKSGK